jgi:hypothetical protein
MFLMRKAYQLFPEGLNAILLHHVTFAKAIASGSVEE